MKIIGIGVSHRDKQQVCNHTHEAMVFRLEPHQQGLFSTVGKLFPRSMCYVFY